MAKRTCVCFISIFLLIGGRAVSQDTIAFPLHIRTGFDLSGPVVQLMNNNNVSYSALASADLNESYSVDFGMKYSSFSATETSYDYRSRGISFVAGVGYNLMKPKVTKGRYYAGIGLRYGISFYEQETERIEYSNTWGTGTMSAPLSHHTGHFLELTPGLRAELFPGLTIGWNIYARLLLSTGAGHDLKPVSMPGYGDATSRITTGAAYFVSIAIPYKKIKVIIKPKPESTEETEEGETGTDTSTSGSDVRP
jgi:hypothetical protein